MQYTIEFNKYKENIDFSIAYAANGKVDTGRILLHNNLVIDLYFALLRIFVNNAHTLSGHTGCALA